LGKKATPDKQKRAKTDLWVISSFFVAQDILLLSHSIYRQPVKIIFPKPAFRQQG